VPTVVLARALTFADGNVLYRRGEPREVPDGDYLRLLATGDFKDPTQELNAIPPSYLRRAPAGTTIPVIRTGGLGDALMAAVGIREAARRHPHLRFAYYTGADFVPLFRGFPWLVHVDELGNLRGRQHWIIDLRGYSERNYREREERVGCFARHLLEGKLEGADLRLHGIANPALANRDRGRSFIGVYGRPTVGIVNGSHSQGGYRNWPMRYVERFASLAHDRGWTPVILDDRHYALSPKLEATGAVNLTGRLTLPNLCAVLAALDVTVSPDTGTFHLAEALGRPTVGYFTTVPPEVRSARYEHVRTLYAALPCSPCYHAPTCGAQPFETQCAQAISPERVMDEVEWVHANPPPYAENRAQLNPHVPAPGPRMQAIRFEMPSRREPAVMIGG
jgi:ADP-heptose:LPS heptosyltransferase